MFLQCKAKLWDMVTPLAAVNPLWGVEMKIPPQIVWAFQAILRKVPEEGRFFGRGTTEGRASTRFWVIAEDAIWLTKFMIMSVALQYV